MDRLIYFLLFLLTLSLQGQVGINTENPETTFEVVGKPDDLNHYDGIIPPRITGDQLAAKFYSSTKKGAIVFVSSLPSNMVGQAVNILEAGPYYFDGNLWQSYTKEVQPIEYRIVLSFDPNSTSPLIKTTNWSQPVNYSGNTNSYLTASKNYTIGTKNFAGLKGAVLFRKVQGIVNVHFQIFRTSDSAPVLNDAFIDIADIYRDIGYIPKQIILLHTENSTEFFPALLENFAIQLPVSSLNKISTTYYTYGEVQGYSNWIKPYLP